MIKRKNIIYLCAISSQNLLQSSNKRELYWMTCIEKNWTVVDVIFILVCAYCYLLIIALFYFTFIVVCALDIFCFECSIFFPWILTIKWKSKGSPGYYIFIHTHLDNPKYTRMTDCNNNSINNEINFNFDFHQYHSLIKCFVWFIYKKNNSKMIKCNYRRMNTIFFRCSDRAIVFFLPFFSFLSFLYLSPFRCINVFVS